MLWHIILVFYRLQQFHFEMATTLANYFEKKLANKTTAIDVLGALLDKPVKRDLASRNTLKLAASQQHQSMQMIMYMHRFVE